MGNIKGEGRLKGLEKGFFAWANKEKQSPQKKKRTIKVGPGGEGYFQVRSRTHHPTGGTTPQAKTGCICVLDVAWKRVHFQDVGRRSVGNRRSGRGKSPCANQTVGKQGDFGKEKGSQGTLAGKTRISFFRRTKRPKQATRRGK